MTRILLTFDEDWADEFSMFGFEVVDLEFLKEVTKLAQKIPERSREYCFGSNEWYEFTALEVLTKLERTTVSCAEENLLRKLFNGSRGYTPFDQLVGTLLDALPKEECDKFCKRWI